MFDRICADNGIRHLLTAPYSPTTTGKVERLHKTMRAEFFTAADRVYATVAELQDGAGRVGAASTTPRGRTSPAAAARPLSGSLWRTRPVAADDAVIAPAPAARLSAGRGRRGCRGG